MGVLVLTRKELEKVMIVVPPSSTATLIDVQVASIKVDHGTGRMATRLAFDAPPNVEIDRLEIWHRKQQGKSLSIGD